MHTDLERLQAVKEGRLTGRGCGKTFARCHDVAGAIELGFKHIYCVVTHHRDISYILPMLMNVLEDHAIPCQDINLNHGRGLLFLNSIDVTIHFIRRDLPEDYMRGIDRSFKVPMGHWD